MMNLTELKVMKTNTSYTIWYSIHMLLYNGKTYQKPKYLSTIFCLYLCNFFDWSLQNLFFCRVSPNISTRLCCYI